MTQQTVKLPGCHDCPHSNWFAYEHDCAYPDCSPVEPVVVSGELLTVDTDPDDPNVKFVREDDGSLTMEVPSHYLDGWK
jgi:hypothetical protein